MADWDSPIIGLGSLMGQEQGEESNVDPLSMKPPQTPLMRRGETEKGTKTAEKSKAKSNNDDDDDDDDDTGTGEEEGNPKETELEKMINAMRDKADTIEDEPVRQLVRHRADNLEMIDHVMCNVLLLGHYPPVDDSSDVLVQLEKNGIDDVPSILTLDADDLQAIGVSSPTFALARKLKALNYWYNSQELGRMDFDDQYAAIMALTYTDLQGIMTGQWKPAEAPSTTGILKSPIKEAETSYGTPQVQEPAQPHVAAGVGSKAAALLAARRRSHLTNAPTHGKKSAPRVTFSDQSGHSGTSTESTEQDTTQTTQGSGSGQPPKRPPRPPSRLPRQPPQPPGGGLPPGWQWVPNPMGMGVPAAGWPHGTVSTTGYTSSRASDFEKGERRSVSDYNTFSNKEAWGKWQRSLVGQAYAHKCENVLDPSYVPDPNDADEVALFESQQRFMFSVFTKTLQETKAQDILQNYSKPSNPSFGDAQSIYADLIDYYETGAQGRASISAIETKLTNVRLDKTWTKSITAFVKHVSGLIQTHKELTNNLHGDAYYIEKLNNTFENHHSMSSHIATLETQETALLRRLGHAIQPKTYADQLHELSEYAVILDDQYKKRQTNRRATNQSERQGRGNSRGGNGGRGGRGHDRNNSRNNNRGGNNRGGNGGNNRRAGPGFISKSDWERMSHEERMDIIRQRNEARGQQANTSRSSNAHDKVLLKTNRPRSTLRLPFMFKNNNAKTLRRISIRLPIKVSRGVCYGT